MRRGMLWTLGLGAVAFGACQSGGPAFTAADEAAIHALFDSTPAWFLAKQFDKWAATFAENATFQPPNAPAVKGRAAIQAWGAAFPELQSAIFSNVEVAGEGNLAWGTSNYALQIKDMPADNGKQLVVFRRAAGKWEVVAVSFNSDLPPPTAPLTGPTRPQP